MCKGKKTKQKHLNEIPRLLEAIPVVSFPHRTDFSNFDIYHLKKILKRGNKHVINAEKRSA